MKKIPLALIEKNVKINPLFYYSTKKQVNCQLYEAHFTDINFVSASDHLLGCYCIMPPATAYILYQTQ